MRKNALNMSVAKIIGLQRSIISISGKDSGSVLQGITTNNINNLVLNPSQIAQSCAFLNPQGRIEFDALIIKPQVSLHGQWIFQENEFWIEVASELKNEAIKHIKQYLFRKKANIYDIGAQLNSYGVYSQQIQYDIDEGYEVKLAQEEIPEQDDDGFYKSLCFADPRNKQLGVRVVSSPETEVQFDQQLAEGSSEEYRALRLSQAVLEGKEMKGKLPLPMNLDLFQQINFNKGCYIGQELTARSYHTGVVRKRCLPIIIGNSNQWNQNFNDILLDKEIKNCNDEIIGKIIAHQNNIGVASLDYISYSLNDLRLDDGQTVKIGLNKYLLAKLEEYKTKIMSRQ